MYVFNFKGCASHFKYINFVIGFGINVNAYFFSNNLIYNGSKTKIKT